MDMLERHIRCSAD